MAAIVTLKSRIPEISASLTARVGQTTKQGAEVIAAAARERVPLGEAEPHLRDTIKVEEADGGYEVTAGGEGVDYAAYVEYGTVDTPAQPYMIPSFEESREAIIARVAGVLRAL